MFWKYVLFELKLLLNNRKNWLLGIVVLLFFPLYFTIYSQTEPETLRDKKIKESEEFETIFYQFSDKFRETPEGKEIYNNLTEQLSLINMQRYYIRLGEDDLYIDNGLKLNELRLLMHESGNKGIPKYLVVPKEEIFKEEALLRYNKEHKLPLQPDPFVASNYLPVALNTISGLIFCLIVLIAGSGMLAHEQQNRSVVSGFPISFMKKINGKVGLHFIQIFLFLILGISLGVIYVAQKTAIGNFASPVLLYQNGDFEAVSTGSYLVNMLIALALITLLLLFGTALLNLLTRNMYATILILLLIFFLPDLLVTAGIEMTWLHPIKYIDIGAVLSGNLAVEFGNNKLDFKHAFVWLVALNLIVLVILYGKNKLRYIRKAPIKVI